MSKPGSAKRRKEVEQVIDAIRARLVGAREFRLDLNSEVGEVPIYSTGNKTYAHTGRSTIFIEIDK